MAPRLEGADDGGCGAGDAPITADAADYFHLPRGRTLIVGLRTEL